MSPAGVSRFGHAQVMLKAVCVGLLGCGMIARIQAANAPKFAQAQLQFYEKQVQPILAENCFKCHSHTADKIKGNLVLDSREGLLQGGETGPAIVPGAPDRSLLIKAVRQTDDDLQMPPKKKLTDSQIAALVDWVKMGAPFPTTAHSPPLAKGRRATTQDRGWWSFKPLRKSEVPAVKNEAWCRNPIDKFILAKLDAEGLSPAVAAERAALMRRVYFDLIGLPPSAEAVARFVADDSDDAYPKLVDGLLAKPQYGEKWARHWLDLVRYAESDGFKADGFRPNAWRYRDYVIRSFNEDKPFNRFLSEQIAADELWPDDPSALVAVSFLRLTIYEYNQRNVKGQWSTYLNDITDVTADAFLGLGLQCARCHDHKFDPILQKDYYRLQAFFAGVSPRDDLPLATPAQLKEYEAKLAAWKEMTAEVRAQIDALEAPVREKTTRSVIDRLPKDIQAIMSKPKEERTPYEQQINDLAYRQVTDEWEKLDGKFKGAEKEKLDQLKEQLAKFDQFKPEPLPAAMLVTDVGPTVPPVTVPKGKSQTPIEPGLLTLLDESPMKVEPLSSASSGRRAALAHWVARADNQFTTRVIVNRLWQRHFGRGLVATLNDFGHLGEEPTHPELLDWLASYLVEHNWSLKAVHRLIVTSAAYRQSSRHPQETRNAEKDPENHWLWRQNLRRLEGDQIRDALLWASGELDLQLGGPSVEASKPRRTIYTKWLRNSRDPLLEAFDPPDAYNSTPQRNVTTTPLQSLVLINGAYTLQRAEKLAGRVRQTTPGAPDQTVNAAYRFAYSRNPTPLERSNALLFLSRQAERIAQGALIASAEMAPMPRRPGNAAAFRSGASQTRLVVPDNHMMPQYDFTIETFLLLRSINDGAAPRTLVSRWDGRKDQPGWALSVSGKSAETSPQTLMLELIGDAAEDGSGGYDAISSGLRIEPNTAYYVAVSVRIGDTSETGVSFYLKNLDGAGPLQSRHVPHRVTANHQSNLPLIIGGRDPDKGQIWDGLIDDVRLTRRALKPDELLIAREGVDDSTVGYWRFEEPDFFKDSSPHGHNVKPDISPAGKADPNTAAFIDFCHVLLNSSEFLYQE